jgi:Fic family protein
MILKNIRRIKDEQMTEEYKQFMLESNRIEGEDRINPGDMKAIKYAIDGVRNLQDILNLHAMLGSYLKQPWVGKLRIIDVQVGPYIMPHHTQVFNLMEKYCKNLISMGSWEAHNRFEKIHPFVDLNGRVGRLIWLSKAIGEGYDLDIPFLQMYYYQTLSKF